MSSAQPFNIQFEDLYTQVTSTQMQAVDLREFDEKPLRLKLKSGQPLSGVLHLAAGVPGREDLVPFLTLEKRQELKNRLSLSGSNRTFVPLTKEQVNEFFEYIPLAQIESWEVIETEVHGMRLVTQNGKELPIHDFQVQLVGLETPGLVKISFQKYPATINASRLGSGQSRTV